MTKSTVVERLCSHCACPFTPQRSHGLFCSERCRAAVRAIKYRSRNAMPSVSPPTSGAISELRVAIDLLTRGYEVFRALSPGASCDLAVLKNSTLIRVEVRTGYRGGNQITVPSRAHRADIFAIVLRAPDEIIYEPQLP